MASLPATTMFQSQINATKECGGHIPLRENDAFAYT